MPKLLDLTGDGYGRLTVLSEGARRGESRTWVCRCDCGTETIVWQCALRTGNTKSCGCAHIERARSLHRTHGLSKLPEYSIWIGMIQRCENPNADMYHLYGGRGIRVCREWRNDFARFFADMGPRPTKRHSIERNDSDKNYEPKNCRWATPAEQSRNTKKNRLFQFPDGRTLCLTDAALERGLDPSRVRGRLRIGWSPAEAFGFEARSK